MCEHTHQPPRNGENDCVIMVVVVVIKTEKQVTKIGIRFLLKDGHIRG